MAKKQGLRSKIASYTSAHPFAILWLALAIAAIAYGAPMLIQSLEKEKETKAAQIAARNRVQSLNKQRQTEALLLVDKCNAEFPRLAVSAAALVKAGKAEAALTVVGPCASAAKDANSIAFIEATKAAAEIERKVRETRESAAKEAVAKKLAQAEKTRRKQEGVSIGMSQEEVIASSWGKPRKINRTTRATSTREQWVYDGGYLYFQDGVLTTIQN